MTLKTMRQWAIALSVTVTLAFTGAGTAIADLEPEDYRAQSGPILTTEELVQVVLALYPNLEIETVVLRNKGRLGLVYEVELIDNSEVYANANTGEILELED